jgi:hypothetical protein
MRSPHRRNTCKCRDESTGLLRPPLCGRLRKGQRPAPVPGDRVAQSFGVDGRGIDKPLQSDSAELCEDGDRGLLGGDVRPDGAVGDSGSDVLAQVGAECLVPFAEDPGQVCRRGRLGPKQQECPVRHPQLAERPDVAVDQAQEPVKAGWHAVEPGHEPALGRVGKALEERLLGPEVVGDEPAAVPGPLTDARQRQRVHPLLTSGPVPALSLAGMRGAKVRAGLTAKPGAIRARRRADARAAARARPGACRCRSLPCCWFPRFFSDHGFGPARSYELVIGGCRYPSKAILGVAYEVATGQRLGSGDFEGGKGGAADVLVKLGFEVDAPQRRGT